MAERPCLSGPPTDCPRALRTTLDPGFRANRFGALCAAPKNTPLEPHCSIHCTVRKGADHGRFPDCPTHIDRFLAEATVAGADDGNSLRKDQLYGLYISWCLLHNAAPHPASGFWAALRAHRIKPGRSGLYMAGPAATDYILATYPALN